MSTSERFEHYALHYSRMGNQPPDYALAMRRPDLFRIVAPWLPADKNTRILDLGFGWGQLLLGLWSAGYRNLTGVELSQAQYDVARSSLPREIQLVLADAREYLKACREPFGLVTVFDVVEHVPPSEAAQLVSLVHGVLATGGSVVVRVPNMANLLATYTRHLDLTHVAGYTEWSLFQLLDLGGFVDHRVIGLAEDGRYRRWYAPWRGFALRERALGWLQTSLYLAMGLRPRPRALGFNLTVQSFKR